MSYEISRKIGNVGWLQLCLVAQLWVGLYLFHNTLQDVITVQLVVMMLLLLAVSIPFFRAREKYSVPARSRDSPGRRFRSAGAMRKVRRVSEDESFLSS